MKRKMKRIWKGILTLVLVATMLFGQFPSGLVLVANAEPAGEIGPAIQEITETPPISAGAGSVVDKTTYVTPESASEIVSSEGNSEVLTDSDKELDSAPVSENDSSLTDYENSEITSEDDSQIPEKGNSEVADSEEESDNAADSEEKVSETADSETAESEEVKSEGETDSSDETAFSAIGKTAVALSGILSDYISGNTPKNAPTEPDNGSEVLGEEEKPDQADIPNIDNIELNTSEAEYNPNLDADNLLSGFFNNITYNADQMSVSYSIDGTDVGNHTIKVTFSCKEGYAFDVDQNITTMEQSFPFEIVRKEITLSSINLTGDREYIVGDGNTNLPEKTTVSYTFNVDGVDTTLDNVGSMEFVLTNGDVGNKEVKITSINSFGGNNYKVTNVTNVEGDNSFDWYPGKTFESNINITKKAIFVSFADSYKLVKESDGDYPVGSSISNPSFQVKDNAAGQPISGLNVSLNEGGSTDWKFSSIVPATDIPIDGVVKENFTIKTIKDNDEKVISSDNFSWNFDIKGTINPKRGEYYIDLTKTDTSTNPSEIADGIQIYFSPNTEGKDGNFWFNGEKLTSVTEGVSFYNKENGKWTECDLTYSKAKKYDPVEMGGYSIQFEDICINVNNVFYGPSTIAVNYDGKKPDIDISKVEDKRERRGTTKYSYKQNPSTDSLSKLCKYGLVKSDNPNLTVDDVNENELAGEITLTSQEASGKRVYFYARDYAGNKNIAQYNPDKSGDIFSPKISIIAEDTKVNNGGDIDRYNTKDFLKTLQFKVEANDSVPETVESTSTGIEYIRTYLLDGISDIDINTYETFEKENQYYKPPTDTQTITIAGDAYHGYQLHFLIAVKDAAGNISYARAFWNGEEMKCNQITFEDGAVIPDESDVIKTSVNLSETFAMIDDGDNRPRIKLHFDDNDNYTEFTDSIAYFYAIERKATVEFYNFAVPGVTFNNDNEEIGDNTSSYDLVYIPSEHAYKPESEIRWTFEQRAKAYEITVADESLPDFAELDLKNDKGEECNKKFVVFYDVPDVTVKLDRDPVNIVERKDKIDYYYSFDSAKESPDYITATISITGDFLPDYTDDNNLQNYVTINYLNNEVTDPVPVYLENWTKNSDKSYYAKIQFKKDGTSSLTVSARNRANPGNDDNAKGKGSTGTFIIDSTEPEFEISYERIYKTEESEESLEPNVVTDSEGKKTYYYGLQDGLTENQATDIKASVSITEANLFKDDVDIEVWKDGELYVGEYKTEYDPNAEWPNANDQKNKGTFILTIPGKDNDGKFDIHVSYTDPALHKMVSGSEDYAVVDGTYDGSERTDIIDTVRPVATYSISEYSDGHYDNDGDYYNYAFETKFTVDDENYANQVGDESYITATYNYQPVNGNAKTDALMECNETDKTYTYQADDTTEDGSFYFYINGKDLAGNVLKVKKGAGTTSNDHFDEEGVENGIIVLDGADSKYESGKKVLDRTNPTVKLELNTESVKKYIPEGYNRYFFNKDFSGSFTVSDVNPDGKKVNFGIGTNNTAKNYATDSVGAINKVGADYPLEETEQTVKYSFNSDKEGLYAYSIYGCDKAGNKIVLAADATGESKAWHKYIEDETGITTYVIVLDKTAPKTNISMDNFYKAELVNDEGTDKYNVSKNKPYQKKTSAVVLFEEDDKSPASLSYKIVSTVEESSVNRAVSAEKDYVKNFTESVLMDGSQTFNIEELSVTDLAGNIVKMPDPGNKIYLDTTPPNHDNLHPTINFVAKSSGSGRGPAGNPLFTGDVNVEVTITDPGEKKNSSGLYQVYYEIQVKEYDNYKSYTGSCIPSSSTGSAGNGLITYGTDGPDYSNPVSTKNQNLKYSDKLTFAFNAGTFNNNDVKVYVWAKDNAGNEITRGQAASYSFGIDTKAPTISVGYDNNDAQNGKYFKANRTATITVTERNFDESRTSISTQAGAHVSGWSYQRGSSPNGDDDRWVASVVYDTDGDYTLGVSATDIVGHGAGGVDWGNSVAPADFTLDKTMPVINVFFDNNNVQNGRYYNANRRATIDITEHNFDTKDVVVERTASIAEGNVAVPGVGAWTRQADLNRSEVFFGQDGDYTMKVDYVDLAGNPAQTFSIDLFTIDTVAPTLEITGVEDKHAYNGNVAPVITYHDINCDKNSAEVRISGYKHPSGSNLNGVRSDAAFGGSFACDNIERVRENDDVYTAIGSVRDLAGNETSKDVMFSVNRFGSTYILGKETEELVDKYYTNQEETLIVKEINVNELTKTEVSFSKGGEPKDLEKGTGYTVQGVKVDNDGWWEYNYEIGASSFAEDGAYIVNLKSEDAATNANSNNSIKQNDGQNELPIEFFIDKAAPSLTISGVEDGARYRETQRIIGVRFDDNSYVADLKFYVNDQLINQYDAKTLAELDDSLIEYAALSRNNWQNVKVEATDAAGNTNEVKIDRFLITRNFFIQFVNNIPLLIGSIVGVSLLVIGLFLLIFFLRRRKERY